MSTGAVGRPWRLGVVGLGVAGRGVIAAAGASASRITVTQAYDPDAPTGSAMDGTVLASDAESLCRAEDVDVVYVASPSALHREHAALAAQGGKHVMIEKPMAMSVDECQAIVEAGREHGVAVLAVHTPSFDAPVRTARALIDSGEVGAPLHVTAIKYVPWLARPRLAYELDNDRGGGVVNRQAPHLVDIAMGLMPARPSRVHATIGSHPRWPGTDGHFTAMIEFADDSVATLIFNGYGYFGSAALTGNIGEDGAFQHPGAGARLRQNRQLDKKDMRSGRIHEIEHGYDGPGLRYPPMHGWTMASCQNGDLVLDSPTGLKVHSADGEAELPFLTSDGFLADAFDELDEALAGDGQPRHDGIWGLQIVEIVAAIKESAATGTIVALTSI